MKVLYCDACGRRIEGSDSCNEMHFFIDEDIITVDLCGVCLKRYLSLEKEASKRIYNQLILKK